jgi:hypothetical protein
MTKLKLKQVMKEAIKSSWIYKLFKWFSKNKQEKIITRGGQEFK